MFGAGVGMHYSSWNGRKHVTNLNSLLLHLSSGVHVVVCVLLLFWGVVSPLLSTFSNSILTAF